MRKARAPWMSIFRWRRSHQWSHLTDPDPSPVGEDTANRRTLVALGFGTFVAALVFVVPSDFLSSDGGRAKRECAAARTDHVCHAGAQRGARTRDRSARRSLRLSFPDPHRPDRIRRLPAHLWTGPDLPVALPGKCRRGRDRCGSARSLAGHRGHRVRRGGRAAGDWLDHSRPGGLRHRRGTAPGCGRRRGRMANGFRRRWSCRCGRSGAGDMLVTPGPPLGHHPATSRVLTRAVPSVTAGRHHAPALWSDGLRCGVLVWPGDVPWSIPG